MFPRTWIWSISFCNWWFKHSISFALTHSQISYVNAYADSNSHVPTNTYRNIGEIAQAIVVWLFAEHVMNEERERKMLNRIFETVTNRYKYRSINYWFSEESDSLVPKFWGWGILLITQVFESWLPTTERHAIKIEECETHLRAEKFRFQKELTTLYDERVKNDELTVSN